MINQGKPITVYGRNITESQRRYTVTEREILSILETLNEFKTILIGQILRIYTVHKNLTCEILILIKCYYGDLYLKSKIQK